MLVCFLFFGFFALPIGIPICSAVGLIYGIRNKDKQFVKWSAIAFVTGTVCAVYTLLLIYSM